MPAARLHPLPFLESHRLVSFVEHDLPSIEPGLRLAARNVPIPVSGGGKSLDALGTDGSGRVVAVRILARLDAAGLAEALSARSWIAESLPALRAVCPALAGGADQVRILMLTGRVEPSAAAVLNMAPAAGLSVLEIAFFESPAGLALSVRRVDAGAAPAPPSARVREAADSSAAPDPLSGIPLTTDEAAEFRRLAETGAPRPAAPESLAAQRMATHGMRPVSPAARAESAYVSGFVEN